MAVTDARHRHLHPCRAIGSRGLAQDHQVVHVVRHLMGQDRQRRDHAQAHVGQECRGNQNAVAKRVHAVASQHRPAAGSVSLPWA
jgi:hypothetical protein